MRGFGHRAASITWRDAAYTAVGLAVLGLQRVQVCRRDVERLVREARERMEAYEPPIASR